MEEQTCTDNICVRMHAHTRFMEQSMKNSWQTKHLPNFQLGCPYPEKAEKVQDHYTVLGVALKSHKLQKNTCIDHACMHACTLERCPCTV